MQRLINCPFQHRRPLSLDRHNTADALLRYLFPTSTLPTAIAGTSYLASGEAARPSGCMLPAWPYLHFIPTLRTFAMRVCVVVCADGGPSNKIWSIW